MSAVGLICEINEELEASEHQRDVAIAKRLEQLVAAINANPDELEMVIDEAWGVLCKAARLCPAAGGAALAAAAAAAPSREVFTLGCATLSEALSATEAGEAGGLRDRAFQLMLLSLLADCLLRIQRKPLHFLALWVDLLLRWCLDALPELPDRPAAAPAPAACAADSSGGSSAAPEGEPTAGGALACVHACCARLAAVAAADAAAAAAGRTLLAQALLQLASLAAQLPRATQAPAAMLAGALVAGPRFGGKLQALLPVAAAAMVGPAALLAALPALGVSSLDQLQDAAAADLSSGAAAAAVAELQFLSPAEVAEGAAVGVCTAVLATAAPSDTAQAPVAALAAGAGAEARLRRLAAATPVAMDLAAQQQSVPLMLVPLVALWAASRSSGRGGAGVDMPVSALQGLLDALVMAMSYNPLEVVRSAAHEGLHALLDALVPAARLQALHALLQSPVSTGAVVALQRLRHELAEAWPQPGPAAAAVSMPQPFPGSAAAVFLMADVPAAAAALLAHGGESGWQEEEDVLHHADAMAAALSLLRFVLLREAAAPLGLLSAAERARLLAHDLRPLRACVERLLRLHAAAGLGSGSQAGEAGGAGSSSAGGGVEALHGFLGLQRLEEVLGAVLLLLEAQ